MNFYKQYPMMRPYIGNNFHDGDTPSLLLIGESHYLPDSSTQHLNAETWYSSSSETLSSDEIGYISTAALVKGARANDFSNKAHRAIWGNPFQEINEFGPRYSDYKRVADDIAFYNFFLRPGLEGHSLDVSPQDVEFANEAFRIHYQALKPTAIIFLSSLAHKYFHPSEPPSVPVKATPHPGSRWWNRVAKTYCNKKGRDILADFIKTTNWPQSPQNITLEST
jgi:hypothetical protein